MNVQNFRYIIFFEKTKDIPPNLTLFCWFIRQYLTVILYLMLLTAGVPRGRLRESPKTKIQKIALFVVKSSRF